MEYNADPIVGRMTIEQLTYVGHPNYFAAANRFHARINKVFFYRIVIEPMRDANAPLALNQRGISLSSLYTRFWQAPRSALKQMVVIALAYLGVVCLTALLEFGSKKKIRLKDIKLFAFVYLFFFLPLVPIVSKSGAIYPLATLRKLKKVMDSDHLEKMAVATSIIEEVNGRNNFHEDYYSDAKTMITEHQWTQHPGLPVVLFFNNSVDHNMLAYPPH